MTDRRRSDHPITSTLTQSRSGLQLRLKRTSMTVRTSSPVSRADP
jgi:hypothetical protein